ncbi:BCCT family transporter [Clostridium sp. B9]|uniref:BCCT family transporter n=1 Tax=Clostridium sp. B9 TaxID=3423224 RepID=UPI003D2EC214
MNLNFLEKNFWKKNLIYLSSIIFSLIIFVWGVFFEEQFQSGVSTTYNFIIKNLSWVYCGLILAFFIYCIWIVFSKFKNVKLGDDNSKPEFSNISWFAMLFSAGIGVGLVFWGVAEPLTHYFKPLDMKGMTDPALEFAFTKSFLHMGLSAWACYAVLALGLAYMHFRRKKPMLISSLLSPLIGEERANGVIGKIIDMMTVLATMAGIITSLGMGTLQVSSGLNYVFGIPETNTIKIVIVLIITVLFLISACSGVGKGIKIISNTNIILAMILFVGAMIVGPFGDMVSNLILGLKGYAIEMATTNNNIFISGEWYGKWTIFYWGWWLAWAPSVAIFIARISKGRTIKEFILGVLFVPAGFCIAWMTVFGTLGINVADAVGIEAISKVETTLFVVFNQYPMGKFLSILAIILIFTFFITSADSATYVLGMIVSNGEIKVKNSKKIVLGTIQSLLTLVLLFAGGLEIIQNFSIIMALPFGIIMFLGVIAFTKALYKNEVLEEKSLIAKTKEKFNNFKIKKVEYDA